ncbi:isocitrate and isopropylmalate dehydrogenases family protein [Tanacetum coccineum]
MRDSTTTTETNKGKWEELAAQAWHPKKLERSRSSKVHQNVGKPKMVEKKIANPMASLLSSSMMVRYLQLLDYADRLETVVKRVIYELARFFKI